MRFAALVLAAVGILLTAVTHAQSDVRRSGEGESCLMTDDCLTSLQCLDKVCRSSQQSGAGESCNKSADCERTLRCFEKVCSNQRPSGEPAGTERVSSPTTRAAGQKYVVVGASTFTVGLALLLVGAYFDGEHRASTKEVECDDGPDCKSFNERINIAADAQTQRTLSDGFFAAGGLGMVAGLSFTIIGAIQWANNPSSRDAQKGRCTLLWVRVRSLLGWPWCWWGCISTESFGKPWTLSTAPPVFHAGPRLSVACSPKTPVFNGTCPKASLAQVGWRWSPAWQQ